MDHLESNPALRFVVKGIIDNKVDVPVAGEKRLARGVSKMWGTNSSDGVPQYVFVEGVVVFSGLNKSTISGMVEPLENCRALFCFGIGRFSALSPNKAWQPWQPLL
eukprot:11204664-Lingulodinium_polyedra.AAC.1